MTAKTTFCNTFVIHSWYNIHGRGYFGGFSYGNVMKGGCVMLNQGKYDKSVTFTQTQRSLNTDLTLALPGLNIRLTQTQHDLNVELTLALQELNTGKTCWKCSRRTRLYMWELGQELGAGSWELG